MWMVTRMFMLVMQAFQVHETAVSKNQGSTRDGWGVVRRLPRTPLFSMFEALIHLHFFVLRAGQSWGFATRKTETLAESLRMTVSDEMCGV